MVKDLRGHEIPPGSDGWAYREDMEQLSRTVNDIVPVANIEARTALVEELATSEDGVPAIVLVRRADAPAGQDIEYTTDGGTTWVPIVGNTGGTVPAILADNAKAATDTPDAYPDGVSVMQVTSAGWPASSGLVVTQRWLPTRVQQFFYVTLSRAYYRSGENAAWSTAGWSSLSAPRMAAGTVTVQSPGANTTGSASVSFPAGLFVSTPALVVTGQTSVPTSAPASASGISASGGTIYVRRGDSIAQTVVQWIAMERTA